MLYIIAFWGLGEIYSTARTGSPNYTPPTSLDFGVPLGPPTTPPTSLDFCFVATSRKHRLYFLFGTQPDIHGLVYIRNCWRRGGLGI
jgi:hypothetical protein